MPECYLTYDTRKCRNIPIKLDTQQSHFTSGTRTKRLFLTLISQLPVRYPYFDAVVGLVLSNDPESYTGGSVATGRASHCRRVKGDDPDEKGYPGLPGWGLGMGLTTPSHITYLL